MPEKRVLTFKSPRDYASYNECNRDPIFLFQVRRTVFFSEGYHHFGLEWDSDAEAVINEETKKEVSDDELVEMGLAKRYWETESVWFDRLEAEGFGRRTQYNYPGKEGVGWRVYCVCAEGELAEVLKLHDQEKTFESPKTAEEIRA